VNSSLGYHWLFWLPLTLIVAATALTWWLIPESHIKPGGRLNLVGSVLMSGWLVTLLLGVSQGPTWGWSSARTLGLFAASGILAVLWIRAENRSAQPLVDMHMMRRPAVWRTNLVALLFGFLMFAAFAVIPEFVQTPAVAGYGFNATISQSGLFLVPNVVASFVMGVVAGRIAGRVGSKPPTVAGSVLAAISFGFLAVAHDEPWQMYLASGLLGIGIGLAFAAMSNLIVEAVPPEQTSVASGMNSNFRTIGGAIGAQVTASLVTASVAADGLPHESGYTAAFVTLAVVGLAAAIAAAAIPSTRRGRDAARQAKGLEREHAALAALATTPGGADVGLVEE
jgi:predicted MFS family arabinose efflux permease